MAPAKDMKPLPFDDPQDAASQDDSQPTLDIQQLLDMQKLSVSTRRREVEDELRRSHRQGWADLERRHDEYRAEYEKNLKLKQRPFLERLAELVDRKKLLETEVEELLDNLQRSDAAVAQQLDACIQSRVTALRK